MRHLQYLEIRNFKGFGDRVRIELDHPAVLAGPNNCGKTTALQAIALWSQAVRTWFDRKGRAPPKERTATGLNRLAVAAVPVRSARDYWHNMAVRTGPRNIPLEITLGVLHDNRVKPVTMRFRCFGDETAYCTPDQATLDLPDFVRAAARLNPQTGGHRPGRPGPSADASDPRPSALASPERPSDRRTGRAPGDPSPETGVRAPAGRSRALRLPGRSGHPLRGHPGRGPRPQPDAAPRRAGGRAGVPEGNRHSAAALRRRALHPGTATGICPLRRGGNGPGRVAGAGYEAGACGRRRMGRQRERVLRPGQLPRTGPGLRTRARRAGLRSQP